MYLVYLLIYHNSKYLVYQNHVKKREKKQNFAMGIAIGKPGIANAIPGFAIVKPGFALEYFK